MNHVSLARIIGASLLPFAITACSKPSAGPDKKPAPTRPTPAVEKTDPIEEPVPVEDEVIKPAPKETPKPVEAAPSEKPTDCGGDDWVKCLGDALKLQKAGKSAEQLTLLTGVCDGPAKTSETSKLRTSHGCIAAAGLFLEGKPGVKQDQPKAAALYAKACEQGDPDGCQLAGLYWGLGRFGDVDLEKAASFLEKACKGGHATACDDAKNARQKAALGAPDTWADTCKSGDAAVCLELGIAVETGAHGHTADPKVAAAHYKAACKGKSATGCARLGALYDSKAIPGGLRKGTRAYQQACDLDDGKACIRVAQAVTKVGSKKHILALEKACTLNVGEGCFQIGVLHKGNFTKGGTPASAKEWFKKACAAGYRAGCGHAR